MRLIDADKAVEVFAKRLCELSKKHLRIDGATDNAIIIEICHVIAEEEIDNIPTAYNGYDIDKILEELREKRKLLNFLFDVINPNDMEDYIRMYNTTDEKVSEYNE